jgi:ubiquinone/menaquinone biosynthesis C-methylase UbiE
MRGPNHRLAIEKYRALAPIYDRWTAPSAPYRRRAVKLLSLTPGESVLDVACGTGVNFSLLERCVGPAGRIVGVDVSPDMLVRARERAERAGWNNVTLIEGKVEEAELGGPFDAAVFSLTHDVLQSKAAVERVVGSLRPGGRVSAFGAKWAPAWRMPINLAVRLAARRYVTTLENLDRPWAELERLVPALQIEPVALGGAYVAWGMKG